MVMISNELTREFQLVLKEELGMEVDKKEAAQVLNNLLGYFKLLADIDQRKVELPANGEQVAQKTN